MSATEAPAAAADRLRESLATTGQAVVFGAWGTGKTTLLREFARQAEERGERVLCLTAYRGDARRPYAVLTQLAAQLRDTELNALSPDVRQVVRALLSRSPVEHVPPHPEAIRSALTAILGRLRNALLTLDDVQWTDDESAEALAHQVHTLPPGTMRTLVAERGARAPRAAWRLCAHHPASVLLPAWDIDDIARLLADRSLPARWAGHVHRLSGGNPVLAKAVLADLPADTSRPEALPVPTLAIHLAASRLAELADEVRHTLRLAALAAHPTPALLRRAGGGEADAHIADAERAGVVTVGDGDAVAFTAGVLREAALVDVRHSVVIRLHEALARVVEDPVQAIRHGLLSHDRCDDEVSAQAEEAGAWARESGERDLAAELLLLAAERTPTGCRPDRLRRLARAVGDAAASGRAELAHRVHEAVAAARPGPSEQVAALLAVVDAGGQALEELDHVLSRAHGAAGGDPALQARVELRQAIRANICGAGPQVACDAAARAASLAHQAGDRPLESMALTMRARMERVVGDPASTASLAAALALAVPIEEIGVAESPQYLAVRFDLFDDRLQEAHERLLELLPFAERSGDSEDLVEVLRSLTEVAARAGDAAKAVTWSERALALCAAAGLSPGPVRWTAAVAQLAGGRFESAVRHAERGLHASRDAHDAIFTSRNLLVLGSAHLATGDNLTALEALRSVAEIEADLDVADLTMLRWQTELAEALAGTGELDEADEVLDRLCAAADASVLAGGVGAGITRARALCVARRGDNDAAVELLTEAGRQFADLGLVLEHGRTLLAAGRIERGRRRPAAARVAWRQAEKVFEDARAAPWQEICRDLLGRLERPARGSVAGDLTEAEGRLAAIVAQGASNQEAAGQLFVSVKTVESMLSRVYRKLGIRSRTQLAQVLRS